MSEINRPTLYFTVFAGIALLALFGYLIFGIRQEAIKPTVVEYNYFTFEQTGGLWQTTISLDNQLYEAVFRYNPEQVEDVYITGDFTGFKTKPIYITFDPESSTEQFKYLALATSELSLHIIRALNFTIEAACTKNATDVCKDRPIITCDSNQSVIYLAAEAPTQITLQGSCVTLTGDKMDLLKSVDRLLFQWYKIMHAQ